ncbi:MAG TPA: hypothetical protein VF571_03740 [Pyrinomonadaceae bacterium]|jgi:hypothetical protein
MSDPLDIIYNACDPFLPALPEYYCDCKEARGGDAFAKNVFQHLRRSNPEQTKNGESGQYRHCLFSGHIGSGKSSELKHLEKKLVENVISNTKYYPVYVDVFDYLDVNDVSITDILLAIVTELAETLREQYEVELNDTYFRRRFDELKKYLLSDVEINEGDLTLGFAKLKVQRLKQDPTAREKIREALKPRIPTILEEINLLFEQARLEIRKKSGETSFKNSDIIVLLDNLEKIQKVDDASVGFESSKRLFIDYYSQLTSLRAHIVFTTPLDLVRSPIAPKLREHYSEPFVLPMVKTFYRADREKPFEAGIDSLKTILKKRLGDIPLEDAFEANALDFLIKYCGGSVRYLMFFVREAAAYADELPITISEAKSAIKQTIQTFSTSIPEAHWDLLAELDLSPDQRFPNDNQEYRAMLENLTVLEYINGGDEDIWEEVAPWYAVNPIVRELREFKTARERIKHSDSRITM